MPKPPAYLQRYWTQPDGRRMLQDDRMLDVARRTVSQSVAARRTSFDEGAVVLKLAGRMRQKFGLIPVGEAFLTRYAIRGIRYALGTANRAEKQKRNRLRAIRRDLSPRPIDGSEPILDSAYRRALATLGEQELEVLTLYYERELSEYQIARHLGVTRGTVNRRLVKARTLMARVLRAMEDIDPRVAAAFRSHKKK